MGAFTIYAIKSALCLALLYLPYTLLMRRDTFHAFNRVLLLCIVVLSLVLPLFKPLSFLPQGEMISHPIESLEEAINPLPIEASPIEGGREGGLEGFLIIQSWLQVSMLRLMRMAIPSMW